MKGISRYNASGYFDPTAHDALTKILREERKTAKAATPQPSKHTGKKKQEVRNGQKP